MLCLSVPFLCFVAWRKGMVIFMKLRFVSIFTSLALIMAMIAPVSASTNTFSSNSAEEILSEFQTKSLELVLSQENNPSVQATRTSQDLATIRHETVSELTNMGYDAYEVTSSTYDTVEEILETDLSIFGLQKDSSYIVIVGDINSGETQSRKTVGTPYYYQYGGKQYKLRAVTITAADSSNYFRTHHKELLVSFTDTAITNCLNASITIMSAALKVPLVVGVVGNLTGLTSVDFKSAKKESMDFRGSASWTRIFTQVWDDDYNAWVAGSSVEYAKMISYIHVDKYDPDTNAPIKYDTNEVSNTIWSPNYFSTTWRQEQAVIGFRGHFPNRNDPTGDIDFIMKIKEKENEKEKGKIMFTFKDGFI